MESPFPLLPPRRQLHLLAAMTSAFNPEYALRDISKIAADGYAGILAVPKITNFGMVQIPTSNEVWEKTTRATLSTDITGLGPGLLNAFPFSRFSFSKATRVAFERLKETQGRIEEKSGFDKNRLRVFPVRFCNDPLPSLYSGEFFLDLASHMWLLSTHHAHDELAPISNVVFRCRGEFYDDHGMPSEMVIGHRDGTRVIEYGEELSGADQLTIIGYAPE